MKKLFFIIALMVCSVSLTAQVKFFDGSFEEAIAKGKSENKPVMLIITAPGG